MMETIGAERTRADEGQFGLNCCQGIGSPDVMWFSFFKQTFEMMRREKRMRRASISPCRRKSALLKAIIEQFCAQNSFYLMSVKKLRARKSSNEGRKRTTSNKAPMKGNDVGLYTILTFLDS